jgi:2-methylcitrate dehydratase PrpD
VGFLDGNVGLAQFSEVRIRDREALALAAKIRYEINPHDEYPRKFTGHLRALLKDGTQKEYRQPYIRGGVEEPLSDSELESKFMENARYGGWTSAMGERLLTASRTLFAEPTLEVLRDFRQ